MVLVFPHKPVAPMLLSPSDVKDPIHEDYVEGLRGDQGVRRRKLWIPLTNHGKNDGDTGFPLIPFFLQRGFGSLPNCSVVNAQRCGCARSNKSKFLLKAAGNKQNKNETMEGDLC